MKGFIRVSTDAGQAYLGIAQISTVRPHSLRNAPVRRATIEMATGERIEARETWEEVLEMLGAAAPEGRR